MPSVKSLNKKTHDKWTANDIYTFWCNEFEKHQGKEYVPHFYKQREISVLKELLESFDIYTILVTIQEALEASKCDSISYLPELVNNDVSNEPEIQFYVNRFGKRRQRELFVELNLIDSMWCQTQKDRKRRETIKTELEGWIITIK